MVCKFNRILRWSGSRLVHSPQCEPNPRSMRYDPIDDVLMCACLQNPWISFGFGLVYLAARIVYFIGYSTGNPENRIPGL